MIWDWLCVLTALSVRWDRPISSTVGLSERQLEELLPVARVILKRYSDAGGRTWRDDDREGMRLAREMRALVDEGTYDALFALVAVQGAYDANRGTIGNWITVLGRFLDYERPVTEDDPIPASIQSRLLEIRADLQAREAVILAAGPGPVRDEWVLALEDVEPFGSSFRGCLSSLIISMLGAIVMPALVKRLSERERGELLDWARARARGYMIEPETLVILPAWEGA